jgi:hypothetical protein
VTTSAESMAASASHPQFAGASHRGQTRARYPDVEGYIERDGQPLVYEHYGAAEETVFPLPTRSLLHSPHWKMQIPYFARHLRVLRMVGRDCLATMDATSIERAVMVSLFWAFSSVAIGSAQRHAFALPGRPMGSLNRGEGPQ